jgi:NAD(P)-dependent dehydrogenase (short-subunit alcohol dehydrogenase family)
MSQARHVGKIVLTNEINAEGTCDLAAVFQTPASVLITGGLSGLGLLVAQRLVERGARHLVLMGRSQPSTAAREAIAAMEKTGARITVVQGDVARPEQVAAVLGEIEATMPPLRGIIHSAGVLNDGVLARQEWSRFREVMAPKVDGAWNLHVLMRDKPLDFFVLFSSAAALFGSSGQGNHAAANAFLDALAHYRRAQGLPALSINWGVWSEIGAAAERNVGRRVAGQGVGVIAPQSGLDVLERLMAREVVQAAVMPIDWAIYRQQFEGGAVPSWLSRVAGNLGSTRGEGQAQSAPRENGRHPTGIRQQLAAAPPNRQRDLLLNHVNDQVVKVVGLVAGQAIDPRQPLNELGLDSLMAVELRNLLAAGLEIPRALPATLVYDYPTIDALTDYLGRDVLAMASTTEPTSAKSEKTDFLEQIEDLTDAEVDRLFAELQG